MSKLLACAAVAALMAAMPFSVSAATRIAGSGQTVLCGPDAPEGYKRPGGYCDSLDDLKSLVPDVGCTPLLITDAGFTYDEQLGRLRLATPIYDPCCPLVGLNTTDLPIDGIQVAVSCYTPPP